MKNAINQFHRSETGRQKVSGRRPSPAAELWGTPRASGQVVFSKKLDAETTYVQTDGFPVGVYLVRLKDANGHQLSVQKLIVAH